MMKSQPNWSLKTTTKTNDWLKTTAFPSVQIMKE